MDRAGDERARDGRVASGLRQGRGRLDLVLATSLRRAGGRGLEQLDLRGGVLLELLQLLLGLLEGRLQLLEERVVLLLAVGERLLQLLELGSALLSRHRNVLLQLLLLVRVAILDGVHRAARAQLGGRELLERREVTAALVVLALLVGRVEVLDRGVATNTVLVAQGLAARRAVNVTDDNLRGILELSGKGVPVGLHLLAVASPRREELHERRLARILHLLVPSVGGQLESSVGAAQGAQESHGAQHAASARGERART